MPELKIKIPSDMDFAELDLARDTSTGELEFSWEPVERICEYNHLDIAIFRDCHEDNMAGLLTAWYAQHLANGGERDAVADDLIAEVLAEDERGGGVSHPPGRA